MKKQKTEKKKQITAAQTREKGVLLLADVVDYTPQADDLGAVKTGKFNNSLESYIKSTVVRYKGVFIKRIGDAVLLFFNEEADAVDFALRLRGASIQGEMDCGDFKCNLRIVMHYGKFDFLWTAGKISDVVGSEGIKVFRIEKEAKKHDIMVTQFLLQLMEEELKDKGMQVNTLKDVVLKGFKRKMALSRLDFPEKEVKAVSNLLFEKMGELERETRQIPVFGNIYQAMSMEENFVNLDITSDEETAAGEREKLRAVMDRKHKQWRETFEMRKDEGFPGEVRPLKVSGLYQKYKRGVVFGLPGSGKTTILKYFAFRELKENRKTAKPGKMRVVLFIPCRGIMSYREWFEQHPETGSSGAGKAEVEFFYRIYVELPGAFVFIWRRCAAGGLCGEESGNPGSPRLL